MQKRKEVRKLPRRNKYRKSSNKGNRMSTTFVVDGLDEYIKQLAEVGERVDDIAKAAIYEGAGQMAKAVRQEIEELPEHRAGEAGGIKEYERKALLKGLGISPIKVMNVNPDKASNYGIKDDFLNAKVGFDGYSDQKLSGRLVRRWDLDDKSKDIYVRGEGYIPIPVIARSIAKGTSFSQKYPFVRDAVVKNEDIIVGVMRYRFIKSTEKIMKKRQEFKSSKEE